MKLDSFILKPQTISVTKNTPDVQIKCLQGNVSVNVCTRQKCEQNAFLCINNKCKCKQPHNQQNCVIYSSLDSFKTIVEQKIETVKQFSLSIQQQILSIVDQLSQLQQNIRNSLQKPQEYSVFTEAQCLLLKALKDNSLNDVKGKHIHEIQQNFKNKHKNELVQQANIKKSLLRFNQEVKILKRSIENNLFIKKTKISPSPALLSSHFVFKDSSIITKVGQSSKLTKFFKKKIIKSQLLYRGSRDSFKVSSFHQKCDNIPNTLTIILTPTNHIFGGFSSYPWTSCQKWNNDLEYKSFLFQLNHNDKFTLKNDRFTKSTYGNSSYGPFFGQNGDICILDDGDKNESFANIGDSYENPNYTTKNNNFKIRNNPYHPTNYNNYTIKSDNSHQKFSGGYNFIIKDYQVWAIIFQE